MPQVNLYPTPMPDQPDGADTRIEVRWYPGGQVGLVTSRLKPGADRDNEFVNNDDPAGPPVVPTWSGIYVGLDRDQINQLIRNLREARTKTYGRDE